MAKPFGLVACSVAVILIVIAGGCHRHQVRKIPNIKGMEESLVIKKLGRPTKQGNFDLTSNPLEYRRGLLVHFPNLEKQKPNIKELYWKTTWGHQVVWLESKDSKMIVIDSLSWPNDVQF